MGSVLVLGHTVGNTDRCALLTLARRLGTPDVLLCGDDSPELDRLRAFGRYGVARVFVADTPDPAEIGAAEAVVQIARRTRPVAVLIGSGREGNEIAARAALRLNSGVITDAVDVYAGPDGPVAVQEVFAGAYLTGSVFRQGIPVIAVRHDAVATEDAVATDAPREEALPISTEPVVERVTIRHPYAVRQARLISRTPKARGARPDLSTAPVVVAGGRGLGSAAGFELLGRVADAFGGAVGGSQAAADLGWCSPQARIDQTGRAVRPRLYLACGISGSVRHRAGMQHARTIVAIDKDPAAPIFGIADFGVVGDVREVLPALLAEIARRRGGSSASPRADDLKDVEA